VYIRCHSLLKFDVAKLWLVLSKKVDMLYLPYFSAQEYSSCLSGCNLKNRFVSSVDYGAKSSGAETVACTVTIMFQVLVVLCIVLLPVLVMCYWQLLFCAGVCYSTQCNSFCFSSDARDISIGGCNAQ